MIENPMPKILLITDDAAEESHTSHILAKYHFTNSLVKLRKATEALRFFSDCNKEGKGQAESLPELIIMGLRDSGRLNLSMAMESRRGELSRIPLILVADTREEEEEVRKMKFPLMACISRPIGFFKLLEGMQKLGMRWIVLRPDPDRLP